MTTYTKKLNLYMRKECYDTEWRLDLADYSRADSDTLLFIESQEITLELPDWWDPRASQIAALHAELQRKRAYAHMEQKEIQEKIDNLLALEHTP